ncbi:histone-lysine N-methyltransferase SETMAR-like [Limulus polyphemus]|uniref:Histone-lysine N-methyltransferase SETMAR-like n=1 Tax=Limulus polyphemus TaxID=6850 RepID=A0ABM1BQJ1_LIMPO|nr:histone-lysine N-methyltransferase SETMAR-like [Limulus polyphemus]
MKLGSNHTTVYRHLQQLGKVPKLGKRVPHELSEVNRKSRVEICYFLHIRDLTSPFLDRFVTGDEKWIFYKNVKVLLSIWWDCKGIIHFELLPTNATINAQVYCQQLERLNAALKKKRPVLVNGRGVVFHQDNARPHTAKITSQKIEELGWEKIPHPPYSPDLAPLDYHLFHSLQNHLDGLTHTSHEEVETDISEFFSSKPKEFFSRGIKKLDGEKS